MVSVGWVIEPLLKYKQIEILNILTIWQQKNLDMVSFEWENKNKNKLETPI